MWNTGWMGNWFCSSKERPENEKKNTGDRRKNSEEKDDLFVLSDFRVFVVNLHRAGIDPAPTH
jgi:hypothetical protein